MLGREGRREGGREGRREGSEEKGEEGTVEGGRGRDVRNARTYIRINACEREGLTVIGLLHSLGHKVIL